MARSRGGTHSPLEVRSTHAERDVLHHVDVALAAVNADSARLLSPFNACVARQANRSPERTPPWSNAPHGSCHL